MRLWTDTALQALDGYCFTSSGLILFYKPSALQSTDAKAQEMGVLFDVSESFEVTPCYLLLALFIKPLTKRTSWFPSTVCCWSKG